ncbi:caspase family protein [Dactylosporangium sp. NPDC005555]|uniref:caspase family protein n=1 Tax=Dactylosporangium sp. NPDC005555 TaxID=3154889 RepID=UPI0033BAACA9
MPKVHALLVGIDVYRLPQLHLNGCVNDVRLAERLLRDRVAAQDLAVEVLYDADATRAAVIGAFRRHLGAAGPGDIALFWFSGHGSTGPLPGAIWYAESAGMCQTTVCHDSRAGAPDLYDKELAVLVREVVTNGARMVSIMDSCRSRSALRDPTAGLTPRLAPALTAPPALRDLLPELIADAADTTRPVPGAQVPGHVALAACSEWELASEWPFPGGVHGVFTEALGHAVARLGPDATYRNVLGYARCQVEGRLLRQTPALEALGDLADEAFLGGTLRPRTTRLTMRHLRGQWEVDAGAVHGIVVDAQLGVHRADPLREVRVVGVDTHRSVVEPVGWSPDKEQQYEMVLTDVPLPPVAVSIRADPVLEQRLRDFVATAGPTGRPSPHIRVIHPRQEPTSRLVLRVRQAEDGRAIQVTSADDKPLAPPSDIDDGGILQTVQDLEHIARWLQVRNLQSASPALDEAVRIEVVPALRGGQRPARAASTSLDFAYTWDGTAWQPPSIYVRLRNTTPRKLFCVLLDLTDRHRLHPNLFPGEYVEGLHTAEAGNRGPITLSLPPDLVGTPGAATTDWLMLLVSEEPFNSDSFLLPRLREGQRTSMRQSRRGITGVLDRLGHRAVRRDLDLAPQAALDWAVTVVEITTRMPAAAPPDEA